MGAFIVPILSYIFLGICIALIVRRHRRGSKSRQKKFANYTFVNRYIQIETENFIQAIKRCSSTYHNLRDRTVVSSQISIRVYPYGISGFCNWKKEWNLADLSKSDCRAMAYMIAENVIANVRAVLPIDTSHLNPNFSIYHDTDYYDSCYLRISYYAKNAKYQKPQSWT